MSEQKSTKQERWSIGKTPEREAAVTEAMKRHGCGLSELFDKLLEADAQQAKPVVTDVGGTGER